MTKPLHFQLKFDGEGLRDGAIDARSLSPSLLALADLIDETSLRVNGPSAKITLRVHSNFRKGSFEVYLSIALGYKDQIIDLFSSKEAQALAAILTILGISGVGLLQAILKSRGRKPKSIITIDKTVRVRIEFDGNDSIEIPEKAYELFNDSATRRAASALVEPLQDEGIEKFEVRSDNPKEGGFQLDKSQASSFIPPDSLEGEIVSDNERYVRIVGMSFKPENKWRVHDGQSTIYVSIDDPAFVSRVLSREEVFGSGDHLRVTIRTRQWRENGEIKSTHAITHVLDHIVSDNATQMNINDEG